MRGSPAMRLGEAARDEGAPRGPARGEAWARGEAQGGVAAPRLVVDGVGGGADPGPATGVLDGGLPYARFGRGRAPLVLFDGLGFENRAPSGLALAAVAKAFEPFASEYTIYLVTRRPGLPGGFTTKDMADDYARALAAAFSHPVDVMGLSTGGEIAQHFAADHPGQVRRLVLGSTAHRVGDEGKALLERWREWARRGDWRALHASSSVLYASPVARALLPPLLWFAGPWIAAPVDPSDYLVTIDADLAHDAKDRLAEIHAPTLVVSGEEDFFYPVDLVQETAAGIDGAWLEVLPRTGHKMGLAAKRRFDRAVKEFLSRGAG